MVDGDLAPKANERGVELADLPITPAQVAAVEALVDDGKLNDKLARQVIEGVLAGEGEPGRGGDRARAGRRRDDGPLLAAVDEALAANPDVADKIRGGKVQAAGRDRRRRDEGDPRPGRRRPGARAPARAPRRHGGVDRVGHARAMSPDPRAVLEAFGLPGEPTAYVEVGGGWSNHVLRLSTPYGDYAVKELRNAWGEPRWLDWLEEGWRLEKACAAAGVAMPEPITAPDGGCLAWVPSLDAGSDVPVRVHRWVESRTVPREPVGVPLAEWVGRMLAALHSLALAPLRPELYAGRVGLTTADMWPDLVARAARAGAPWASDLAAAEPVARRASALLVPPGPADAVLCHGDVDQKNLLLGAYGPLLIDWDVVLPAAPTHDLAHAALTMAAWRDAEVAAAVVRGYRVAGGRADDVTPVDLGPALASRLGWIRFIVDRALDQDADEAARASAAEVPELLADLGGRVALAEQVTAWLP